MAEKVEGETENSQEPSSIHTILSSVKEFKRLVWLRNPQVQTKKKRATPASSTQKIKQVRNFLFQRNW